jgi:hypothetical protein
MRLWALEVARFAALAALAALLMVDATLASMLWPR